VCSRLLTPDLRLRVSDANLTRPDTVHTEQTRVLGVTAQKIIDFRTKHGPFSSADELDAVPGIGPARMETLHDLVAP
jgi:Helix-hairpin-helix motif